jgi:hypothetical protein
MATTTDPEAAATLRQVYANFHATVSAWPTEYLAGYLAALTVRDDVDRQLAAAITDVLFERCEGRAV